MVKSNSSTGNKNKKSSTTTQGKMKKNSKSSSKSTTVLGPMDFFVKRSGTSANSGSPPSSTSTTAPPSPSSTSTTEATTTTTTTTIPSATSSHLRSKKFRTRHANVCGETELSKVTSIVREWVETELELIDEDVAYVLKFFYDLIEERSFIFLAAVIQDFYAAVGSRDEHDWKEAYNNVIMSIQSDLRSDSTLPQDLILPTFEC